MGSCPRASSKIRVRHVRRGPSEGPKPPGWLSGAPLPVLGVQQIDGSLDEVLPGLRDLGRGVHERIVHRREVRVVAELCQLPHFRDETARGNRCTSMRFERLFVRPESNGEPVVSSLPALGYLDESVDGPPGALFEEPSFPDELTGDDPGISLKLAQVTRCLVKYDAEFGSVAEAALMRACLPVLPHG